MIPVVIECRNDFAVADRLVPNLTGYPFKNNFEPLFIALNEGVVLIWMVLLQDMLDGN